MSLISQWIIGDFTITGFQIGDKYQLPVEKEEIYLPAVFHLSFP